MNKNKINRVKKTFNKNGFAILRNFISKEKIDEIKNDVDRLIQTGLIKNKLENVHYIKTNKLSSVHNIANYMPYHKKFFNYTQIHKVFYGIYGPFQKKWFNSSYFIKPKKIGIATKAHQDNAFFNLNPCEAFTCWVPTDSVNEKNSPLYYYLGSQREGLLPHNPEGNLGASLCIPKKYIKKIKRKYKKQYVRLNKGDCIIHNPLVIHGSEKNKSIIDRSAFNFSIKSKRAKQDIAGWDGYRKKLNIFLKNKKKRKN